jgi:hypothetical protein
MNVSVADIPRIAAMMMIVVIEMIIVCLFMRFKDS